MAELNLMTLVRRLFGSRPDVAIRTEPENDADAPPVPVPPTASIPDERDPVNPVAVEAEARVEAEPPGGNGDEPVPLATIGIDRKSAV